MPICIFGSCKVKAEEVRGKKREINIYRKKIETLDNRAGRIKKEKASLVSLPFPSDFGQCEQLHRIT